MYVVLYLRVCPLLALVSQRAGGPGLAWQKYHTTLASLTQSRPCLTRVPHNTWIPYSVQALHDQSTTQHLPPSLSPGPAWPEYHTTLASLTQSRPCMTWVPHNTCLPYSVQALHDQSTTHYLHPLLSPGPAWPEYHTTLASLTQSKPCMTRVPLITCIPYSVQALHDQSTTQHLLPLLSRGPEWPEYHATPASLTQSRRCMTRVLRNTCLPHRKNCSAAQASLATLSYELFLTRSFDKRVVNIS